MRTATTTGTDRLDFDAPGPGVWQRDEDHWPRPVPASYREIYPDATVPYVKEWTSRYGLLMDYFETVFVNGFGYARMHAVGEPEGGGSGPPPKLVFKALVRLHPQLRARRRAASGRWRSGCGWRTSDGGRRRPSRASWRTTGRTRRSTAPACPMPTCSTTSTSAGRRCDT